MDSPISHLPPELLDQVLAHISQSHPRESLSALATISKPFQVSVERLTFRSLNFKFRLIDLQHFRAMASSPHGAHRMACLKEIRLLCYLRAEAPMHVADAWLHPSSTLASCLDELVVWKKVETDFRLLRVTLEIRAAYLSNLSSRANDFYPGRPHLTETQLMEKVEAFARGQPGAEVNIEGDTDCLFDVLVVHLAGLFPGLKRLSLDVLPREPQFGPRRDILAEKGVQDFAQALYEMQYKPSTMELVRGAREDQWLCWDFALTSDMQVSYSSGPDLASTLSSSLRLASQYLRHVSVCDVNLCEDLFWPTYTDDASEMPHWPHLEFLDVYTGSLQGFRMSTEYIPRQIFDDDRLSRFALVIAKAAVQMPKLRWLTCTWKSGEIPCERPYEGTTFMYRSARHLSGLSPWRWGWYSERMKSISPWSGEFGRDDWSETRSGREIIRDRHQVEWAIPVEADSLRWRPPREATQLWRDKCGPELDEDFVTLERRSTTGTGGGWKRCRNDEIIDFWD